MGKYTGYIYSITNELNGKSYIGKTNDLVRRWKEHCYGKGNTAILNNAFKKYGLEHFVFDIVAQIPFDTIEELNNVLAQLEMYYIELYDTFYHGYNATAGGDGICFYKHSEETKEKLRQLQKEKWLNPELRARMATAALGYHHTDDAKRKISQALLNRDSSIYKESAEKRRGRKRDLNVIMRGAVKRRKPILQYDLEGNFIKEWEGAACVPGFERSNIGMCCKGKLSSTGGYIWRFKNSDDYPKRIEVPNRWKSFKRPILQYSLDGTFVARYNSVTEASKATGITTGNISQCALGKYKQIKGFVWKYENEMEVANV